MRRHRRDAGRPAAPTVLGTKSRDGTARATTRRVKRILLCCSNPLLTRSLYGMLRDEGHAVESVEHPALAVQKVLAAPFDLTIIDAEPFGLSAEDAAQVIKAIVPGMPILCIGGGPGCDHLQLIKLPADLAAIRELIHVIAA